MQTRKGYCDAHQRDTRQYDQHRGNSAQRGYNTAWRKFRDGFLRRHPLCVMCEAQGRVTPATVVDHITPHKGDTTLFWAKDNHQALCASCHSRKTLAEDMGAWVVTSGHDAKG